MLNRLLQIRRIIRDNAEIFDRSVIDNINSIGKEELPEIYFPYVPQDAQDYGLLLKDSVGYISIQETFKGKVEGYVYRFFSEEYKYLFCRENAPDSSSPDFYTFHYDKEENDSPHAPHLTTLLPDIRHISSTITLQDFLGFIRNHFFILNQGDYVRKKGNLWDNNFV